MTFLDAGHVAKALGGEARGNRVSAPAPGHSAKDRSLSILVDEGAPDGFVVHGFADDSADALALKDYVRGRLGLPEWKPNGHGNGYAKPAPRPRAVCHYEYQTADGEPYLRVTRLSDKSFRQYHWEIDGWEPKKPAGPAVPYRLPEILANPDATIWLCEGEKDADSLAALGLIATTNPGGSSAFTAEIAQWLDGQRVVALPDNDTAGRKWAESVATHLPDATILHLPGLPNKGDVTDWLIAGGTVDELIAMADDPPPVGALSPDDTPLARITPTPFAWASPNTIPPREWVYDTHLIRKFVSLTVSPGGLGKSSLALVEAMSMAANRPLLADATVHEPDLRVWYWNGEDPQEETQRRVVAAASHYELPPESFAPRLFTDTGREMTITLGSIIKGEIALDEDLFLTIEQAMLAAKIDVLILDPFVSAHRLGENDNNAIDAVVKRLGKLADRTNAAVEIVHHVRKPSSADAVTDVNDARGASALIGGVRSARVLNVMSADIATAAGISPDIRHRYFSVTDGKANMSAKGSEPSWRYLESVNLNNATETRPKGDSVGVVTAYKLPEAARSMADLSNAEDEMRLILSNDDTVRHWPGKGRGQKPKNWLGHRILDALHINDGDHDAAMARLINGWIKEGKVVTRTGWVDRNRTIFLTLPGQPYAASDTQENPDDMPF